VLNGQGRVTFKLSLSINECQKLKADREKKLYKGKQKADETTKIATEDIFVVEAVAGVSWAYVRCCYLFAFTSSNYIKRNYGTCSG